MSVRLELIVMQLTNEELSRERRRMFKKIYKSLYIGIIEIVLGASTYLILHILNIPNTFLMKVFALAFVAIGILKLSCWKTGYEMDKPEADDIEKLSNDEVKAIAGNASHSLNEEQILSLESGEFIHTIANLLINKIIKIDSIDEHRSKLIAEISEALRSSNVADADARLLLAEGFKLSEYPRYAWIDLANRIICACDTNTPISEIIKTVRNSTHRRGEK